MSLLKHRMDIRNTINVSILVIFSLCIYAYIEPINLVYKPLLNSLKRNTVRFKNKKV